ncbi:hypothetical protein [Leptolyngbya sp. AN02str]|uniref:hypothetical protein n=1 Tax=Leptolyngbya sp. AN02str TaxID=3423363 RepID=UPI003D31D8EF
MAISLHRPALLHTHTVVPSLKLRLIRWVQIWRRIYPYACIAGIAVLLLISVAIVSLHQYWKANQKPAKH